MNILLIEDEPLVAKNLEKLVAQIEPTANILAILDSVSASLDWFRGNPEPDLVLSDIQLSDGVSFEIFQEVQPSCPIIFTTAYDEYAIRAFKLNSIDYLLKPIDNQELTAAFEKFKRLAGQQPKDDLKGQIQDLLLDLKSRATYKKRFTAHHHRSILAVPEERVTCFYRDSVIWMQTIDNQSLITDYNSLDEVEELLDPSKFYRANRQWIVKIDAIESYRTHFTGKIELKLIVPTKEEITISKDKAHDFRVWFEG
ncbi:MAG: LytTR family DNA-binding domain-containing protein [Spirosomaceae bacterium]|jgi:DNA-binding LytR/AlgR family response regulator|nr:LytTR family DNA-binding domain-containing protein [Spirosomataceae bacterium]